MAKKVEIVEVENTQKYDRLIRVLLFITGAILSTAAVWAFVYVSHCDTTLVFVLLCSDRNPYLLPIICTFAWPFVIGLGIVWFATAGFEGN